MKNSEINQQCKNSHTRSTTHLTTLKKRFEFQAVAKGVSETRKAFKIQTIKRNVQQNQQIDPLSIRIGYTVTKRTGNSPERNRIKRRLRAAWHTVAPTYATAGNDYVLIGRRQALDINFRELESDLMSAVCQIGKIFSEPNHNPQ